MNRDKLKILFLADTHLGFDFPFRPRVQRRRRGPDFFANFEKALEPAYRGDVDFVIHGGDILFRSKVPARLVELAFRPLKKVADTGIPVIVVPGNHERSVIPFRILAEHPNIHVFHSPKTFTFKINEYSLAFVGFPCERDNVRKKFPALLENTGWRGTKADCYFLCVHQCVEGAAVGPKNYTFRYNHDVIRTSDIPEGFTAVLSGHIHRFQVLTKDLKGQQFAAPVFYPGSIERTSFAEKDEKKGYLILEINTGNGTIIKWSFHELPARPMVTVDLNIENNKYFNTQQWLVNTLKDFPEDSIVRIKIRGIFDRKSLSVFKAESLRSIVPDTMNVNVIIIDVNEN